MMETIAEQLIDIADEISKPKSQLLVFDGYSKERCEFIMSRAKLALDLKRRGPKFITRAILESWDLKTLIEEMY